MNTRKLSAFVFDRIEEHPDADEAEVLRESWNAAHDQIDITPPPWGFREHRLPSPERLKHYPAPEKRQYLPGEVKDIAPLKRLARNWATHPDYRSEWSVD